MAAMGRSLVQAMTWSVCALLVSMSMSVEAARPIGEPAGLEAVSNGMPMCQCSRVYKPVCSQDGTKLGNNRCLAECAGHESETLDETWCDKSQYITVVEDKGREDVDENKVAAPATNGIKMCSCASDGPEVCDVWGNVVAANICEAEFCRGLEWGTFSAVWCRGQGDTDVIGPPVANSTCDCPESSEPVCGPSGNVVASSRCEAEKCLDLVWGSFAESWCTPAATAVTFPECGDCPEDGTPVCNPSGERAAGSACEAECLGLPWGSFAEGWCASNQTEVEFPLTCACPDGEDPVCGPSGTVVARSRCAAEKCLDLPWGSFAEGWCDQGTVDEATFPGCGCPDEGQPVCDERGNVVARSWCEAEKCLGLQWGSFSSEWCGSVKSVEFPETDCGCPSRGQPVCDWDGNVVASNQCMARCLQLTLGTYAAEWCGNEGDNNTDTLAKEGSAGSDEQVALECNCPTAGSRPVCNTRGEVMASSRCEAEQCLDLLWGTFSEEWCDNRNDNKVPTIPEFPGSSCDCFAVWEPVCDWDGVVVAGNQCKARCLQLTLGTYAAEWCGNESDDMNDDEGAKDEPPLECDCPDDGRPVCNTRGEMLASSRCEAEQCLELLWGTFSEVWCRDDEPSPEFPDSSCGCPDGGAPVCDWDGDVVAGNECKAKCLKLTVATYAAEWCENEGDDSDGTEVDVKGMGTRSSPEACDCPDEGQPVCDTNGFVLAHSRCEAKQCLGLDWAIYAEGWCDDGAKVEFPECDCPDKYNPVCDSNGREVAHNACVAKKCFNLLWGTYNRKWCLNYEHNNAASEGSSSAGSSVHSSSSAFDQSSSAEVSSSETSSEEAPSSSGYWKWHSSSDGTPPDDAVVNTPAPPSELDEFEMMELEEIDAPPPSASDDLFYEGVERRGLMELDGIEPPTDAYAALGSIWGRDPDEVRELFDLEGMDDAPAPTAI